MAVSEKILYLFSSTVTPYIKDILDILFLPSGFVYRFRYDLQWVSDELNTDANLKKVPSEVLLVHAHITKREDAGKTECWIEELIPIRKATIIGSAIVGDFVVFQFKLGDYVKYDAPYSAGSQNNPYHQRLFSITPPSLTKNNTTFRKLAFLADRIDLKFIQDSLTKNEQDDSNSNWSKLVTYIGRTQPHVENKSIFLKLLSISNIAKDESLQPSELSKNYFGFEMKPNTTYGIRILQRSFEGINLSFRMKIETDQEILKPIKSDTIIQGKYDVLEFIISSGDIHRTKHTSLFIKPDGIPPNDELIVSLVCGCRVKAFDHGIWIFPALIIAGILISGLTGASTDPNTKNYGPLIGAVLVGAVPYMMRH